jgi:toll-interacting protein
MVGQLPDDFLRITPSEEQEQIASDARTAMVMHQQQQQNSGFRTVLSPTVPMPPLIGRLDLLVLEAKLVKNYGLTRMDPYVRIRFGMHQIYESHTAVNGGKNPRWNKMFHCFLPEGQDNFHLQIMDERTFSDDEEIAFVHYEIPDEVFNGRTKEEWLDVHGRSGKEGVIGIVVKFTVRDITTITTHALTSHLLPCPQSVSRCDQPQPQPSVRPCQ